MIGRGDEEPAQPSDGETPDLADVPLEHPAPSLRSFLHSRFFSANGAAAALYLLLSVWVLRNPARAMRLWERLQGR